MQWINFDTKDFYWCNENPAIEFTLVQWLTFDSMTNPLSKVETLVYNE